MQRYRNGFGLIEILVVIVVISLLALVLIPRMMGTSKKTDKKHHTPIERAKDTAGISYISQINQAIMMYKQDNDGKNPPDLKSLKSYQLTDEMLVDPVTKQPLPYNPVTGTVGETAPTASGGVPSNASPRQNVGPGGVSLPNIPQPATNADENE